MADRATAMSPLLALAALVGVVAAQGLPQLPPWWLLLLIALPVAVALYRSRWRWIAVVLVGFVYAVVRGQFALDARLPRELEGRDFVVIGQIDDLPVNRDDASRFVLRIESAALDGQPLPLRGLLRLSWYGDDRPILQPCSRWQLSLRLKRPRGLVNRGGFDFERHALERGIVATGYVRSSAADAQPLGVVAGCIDRWRDQVSQGIAARVADAHDAALLQALAVGDTRGLSAADWDVARANGVSHLLSISGFHVGVAALFGAWLLRALWWIWPTLALRWPRPVGESVAALLTAASYGALAGNSLPTLRTVLMIAVFALMRLSRRSGSGPQSLALAAIVLLAVDPLAVLGAGFWLSFVGVAFLMLGLQQPRDVLGHLRALGSAQWVMTLSLLPLSLWFFGQTSLLGAVSNLIAIPLVSLAIVPLALISALLLLLAPMLASPFVQLGAWIGHLQWALWQAMADWPGAHWSLPEVGWLSLLLAMIGATWLFLPRGLPLRWMGMVLFLPLLWPVTRQPAPGAFDVHFIDVGQGLAVLVRTNRHNLLYDAGARFPSGFDLGTAAVLPTLQALGITQLDLAVASHADNDHAGGMAAIMRVWPQAQMVAGEAERGDLAAQACTAGQAWDWDGVRIRVLRPSAQTSSAADSNDRSCVLLIEGQGGRLLLGGDISSRVEALIAAELDADDPRPLLLSVSHHGSRRSSSAEFIARLRPQLAVVSAAWLSRFGHPHPLVVQRFADAGVPLRNTADSGGLEVQVATDGTLTVIAERERRPRYWRE